MTPLHFDQLTVIPDVQGSRAACMVGPRLLLSTEGYRADPDPLKWRGMIMFNDNPGKDIGAMSGRPFPQVKDPGGDALICTDLIAVDDRAYGTFQTGGCLIREITGSPQTGVDSRIVFENRDPRFINGGPGPAIASDYDAGWMWWINYGPLTSSWVVKINMNTWKIVAEKELVGLPRGCCIEYDPVTKKLGFGCIINSHPAHFGIMDAWTLDYKEVELNADELVASARAAMCDGAFWSGVESVGTLYRLDQFTLQLERLPTFTKAGTASVCAFGGFVWMTMMDGMVRRYDPRTNDLAAWQIPDGYASVMCFDPPDWVYLVLRGNPMRVGRLALDQVM